MSSQQLVRKLLRATEEKDTILVPPAAGKKKSASARQQNKKRKRRGEEDEAVAMTEDQIVDWHVQTLILGVDRKMAARGSRNSNARAIEKTRRRLDQRQEAKTTTAIQPPGRGCGRTSAAQKTPEPTFNKKRYEAEKKQKKLEKLRRALKTLDKEDKKKKKRNKTK